MDPENGHASCPTDSWCLFKTDNPGAFENKPYHLAECFLEVLKPVYNHYTQDSILQRMLPGYNTNINESLNSVLWSILPKTKFHGKRRQEAASMLGVIHPGIPEGVRCCGRFEL